MAGYKKWLFLICLFLVLYVAGFMFLGGGITGYATAPNLRLVMEKTLYSEDEMLKGSVILNFTDSVVKDTVVSVEIDGIKREMSLTDILDNLSLPYNYTSAIIRGINPSVTKEVATPNTVAFVLPKDSTVESITMLIAGNPDEAPSFAYLDVAGDGTREWQYLGNFVGWDELELLPSSLDTGTPGTMVEINSYSTLYCELIDLPYSKDFRVSAHYQKIDDGADIRSVILSFDGVTGYGGANYCDLPENSDLSWQNCNITFGYAIQGKHLVCVYIVADQTKPFYRISRDNTFSNSRYECGPIAGGSTTCQPATSKDYFIKANQAGYTRTLAGSINFLDWLTGYNFTDSLTLFLAGCTPNDVGDCTVPIRIDAAEHGKVTLGNLKVRIREPSGAVSLATMFYDTEGAEPEIYSINSTPVENFSLGIPLSLFGISTPDVTADRSYELKVRAVPGNLEIASITVSKEVDIDMVVAETKTSIQEMGVAYAGIAPLLGIDLDTAQLDSFKQQAGSIKASNLTAEEKANKLNILRGQLIAYVNKLPKTIAKTKSIKDIQIIEPGDIIDKITATDKIGVYQLQGSIDVTVEANEYVVTTYDNTLSKYTYVEKTIAPNVVLDNVYIYELIPKAAVSDISKVRFASTNYEVVEDDPIVRFYYARLSAPVKITYAFDTALTSGVAYNLKTIAAPRGEEALPTEPSYECGDKICSRPYEDETLCPEDCLKKRKINWWLIIAVLAAGAAFYIYISFYTGRIDIRRFIKGKVPFKSEDELKKIKNYIRVAEKNKVNRDAITDALLRMGWKKNQLMFAFEDLEWDKRRSLLLSRPPATDSSFKGLEGYIEKCYELGIQEKSIVNTLKIAGWREADIKTAIGKARKGSLLKLLFRKRTRKRYFFEE